MRNKARYVTLVAVVMLLYWSRVPQLALPEIVSYMPAQIAVPFLCSNLDTEDDFLFKRNQGHLSRQITENGIAELSQSYGTLSNRSKAGIFATFGNSKTSIMSLSVQSLESVKHMLALGLGDDSLLVRVYASKADLDLFNRKDKSITGVLLEGLKERETCYQSIRGLQTLGDDAKAHLQMILQAENDIDRYCRAAYVDLVTRLRAK